MSNETEWVLVPREPTPEMEFAGARSWIDGQDSRPGTSTAEEATLAYRAMLAAAPQPPAEAQAVACSKCGVHQPFQHSPDCGRTPPSAPVGVLWDIESVEGDPNTLVVNTPDRKAWIAQRGDRVFELASALHLAQQPAADSRICRVCDGGPGNDGLCLCGHREWEQPAAVDGASPYPTPRNRQEAAALARLALAYLGATSAHIEAAVARCETDLAAQQGGSTDE